MSSAGLCCSSVPFRDVPPFSLLRQFWLWPVVPRGRCTSCRVGAIQREGQRERRDRNGRRGGTGEGGGGTALGNGNVRNRASDGYFGQFDSADLTERHPSVSSACVTCYASRQLSFVRGKQCLFSARPLQLFQNHLQQFRSDIQLIGGTSTASIPSFMEGGVRLGASLGERKGIDASGREVNWKSLALLGDGGRGRKFSPGESGGRETDGRH